VLLMGDRMLRVSQLNTEIARDFEARRIRMGHHILSAYLRVPNQVMQKVDIALGSRRIET